jgi:hypothetical protein
VPIPATPALVLMGLLAPFAARIRRRQSRASGPKQAIGCRP